MTVIYPEATPVQGNTKVQAVLSIGTLASPDLSSEINAGTSLDLSCFLRDWNPEINSNTGSAPNRLCTVVSLPVEGNTQFQPIPIRYIYDPQGDNTVDENKAMTLLTRGTEFYAVVRKGLDAQNTAWAAGQRVEVWKFRCGRQNRLRSGDDEFSEYEVVQNLFPQREPELDAVIVA